MKFGDVYPRPIWKITLEGEDLSGRIQPRLMELSITDHRGLDADELNLSLEDADGQLAIPPKGAKIQVFIGWSHTGLYDKGTYVVDEIEHSGAPDKLTIRARSAEVSKTMGEKKELSWDRTTVGALVAEIAAKHELTPVVSDDLAPLSIEHIDQTSESDASFLTRLAEQFDAIATVKSGNLLFYKIGRGVSLSGLPLETARITRADGDSHRFSFADRDSAGAVTANYYDTARAELCEVTVSAGPRDDDGDIESDSARVKTLRHTYPTEQDARRAAQADLDRIQRGAATFSLSLAYGRPELIPDLPAIVSGWKRAIDEVDWLITQVSHKLSNSGLTSEVEMEIRTEAGDEEKL
jgi:phage protein D